MAGVDDGGLYYADRFFAGDDNNHEGGTDKIANYKRAKTTFKKFIREYRTMTDTNEPRFVYRDQLKRRYLVGEYCLEIVLNDLRAFDEGVAEMLCDRPQFYMVVLEEAATECADEMTTPRAAGHELVEHVQVMIVTNDHAGETIRSLKSSQVSRIVKLTGIVIAASQVRSKATKLAIQCNNCGHKVRNIELKAGFDGYQFPRKCANAGEATGVANRCPIDPYTMLADECECVDFQTLKLQESPDDVPQGEMPRHMQLFTDRFLTDRVAPGNRVTIVGIYSIKKGSAQKNSNANFIGVRVPYLRVLGLQTEESNTIGGGNVHRFTDAEVESFRAFAAKPDVYEQLVKSIAPSIWGAVDIKKAVACLLFGGSRKRLPDGLTRRGDINVLLLGDPGTAKSQLLKFVERCSPIGVYTSGKGSSAAGLTAAVIKDPQSKGFIMEGGAMVLADGGTVCIDEFDKMREDDRVAIHEAMEQQTISIAKAGITTTLNSRCSVLAAANSVFGRWDDMKGQENIDFMPTILSRFDAIFIVKDEHDDKRDTTLAKHVIRVHMAAANTGSAIETAKTSEVDDELPLHFLKRYISYCRTHCAPRLDAAAGEKLISHYVRMRNPEQSSRNKSAIPITVRQLEAIVRMSESLAKMSLLPFATDVHVDEALRIFRVSTLQAAATGNLAGVEGFSSAQDQETLSRVETQIKQRFAVGAQVAENVIVNDLMKQNYSQSTITKVLAAMIRRGEVQQKYQRKMLFRLR